MRKIPSDEELDRASRMMEQQFHNLNLVEKNVTERFRTKCPLYRFYVLPQGDDGFRAYVFLETDRDVKDCEKKGIIDELKDCVIQELARAGRWTQSKTTIALELDSDENVTANYEGDYFLRLR